MPFRTPRDPSDPGMEPTPLVSPALAGRFFVAALPGKPLTYMSICYIAGTDYSIVNTHNDSKVYLCHLRLVGKECGAQKGCLNWSGSHDE